MLCAMFLSMWISNTAATAMMVPIVDAIDNAINAGDIELEGEVRVEVEVGVEGMVGVEGELGINGREGIEGGRGAQVSLGGPTRVVWEVGGSWERCLWD